MATITTTQTTNGYVKSIAIPNGRITATIDTSQNLIYLERKAQGETENMMMKCLHEKIRIRESNLDEVLIRLAAPC